MLVECSNCGAPLDVKEGQAYTTCAYCRHKSLTRHLQTVATATPAGWQPPPEWRPPQYVSANSGATLRYHSQPSRSGIGVLFTSLFVLGTVGAVFLTFRTRTTNSLGSNLPESDHVVVVGTSAPLDSAQKAALSDAMERLRQLSESVASGQVPSPGVPSPKPPADSLPVTGKPPKAAPRVTPPSRELAWDVAHRLKGLNYKNCFFQDMSPPQNGMFPLRYTTRVTFEGKSVKGVSVSGSTNKGPDGFRWKDFQREDAITAADVAKTEAKVESCIKSASRRLSMPDNSSKGTIAVEFTGVDLISASGS
jgi:DNA-directed RNA polymerase subunit RPC12/RpoP